MPPQADQLLGAMKLKGAAHRLGHFDQYIRGIAGDLVLGQRCLGNIERSQNHVQPPPGTSATLAVGFTFDAIQAFKQFAGCPSYIHPAAPLTLVTDLLLWWQQILQRDRLCTKSGHVDGEQQISPRGNRRSNRQGVEQAAIHQRLAIDLHRRDHARYRDGSAYCVKQRSRLKPHFTLVQQVGGNGGKGQRQLFDKTLTDQLFELAHHLGGAHGAHRAPDHINQFEHIEVVELTDPVTVGLKLASGIHTGNDGAHRATGERDNLITTRFQFLDHADMRIATGTTATQCQRHTLARLLTLHATSAWHFRSASAAASSRQSYSPLRRRSLDQDADDDHPAVPGGSAALWRPVPARPPSDPPARLHRLRSTRLTPESPPVWPLPVRE